MALQGTLETLDVLDLRFRANHVIREAIEDMTGGVTTEIYSTDILDRKKFWEDELMKVNKDFLFGCATGFYADWLDPTGSKSPRERQGISEGHAYSIMEAREVEDGKGNVLRFLKVRNPWGRKEWDGRWSDGSAEWTPEWMKKLGHQFGNDGVFWILYEDVLKKYQHFDRTRIFDEAWHITQKWTPIHVPWVPQYHSTKFRLTLKKKSHVVLVLAQLDTTYFGGLEGAYGFDLEFRLEDENNDEEGDYIVRSNGSYAMERSVNTDIELEAGTYSVRMKVTATRTGNEDVEDVVPKYANLCRDKFIQIAQSYDFAHAKGIIIETDEERREREAQQKAWRTKLRERWKKMQRAKAEKDWKKRKAQYLRDKKKRQKKKKVDLERMARGRPSARYEENADSLFVGRSGSEDGIELDRPDHPTTDKHGPVDKDARNIAPEPVRLRSFSGDPILVGLAKPDPATHSPTNDEEMTAGPDAEQDSIAVAVSSTIGSAPDASTSSPTADGVVEPLHTVIERANAESAVHQDGEETPTRPIAQINGVDAVTDVRLLANAPPVSKVDPDLAKAPEPAELEKQNAPQANEQVNRTKTVRQAEDANASDLSDTDSFSSFSWQSDLDMPPLSGYLRPSSSDSDSDSDADSSSTSSGSLHPRRQRPVTDGSVINTSIGRDHDDEDLIDLVDSWNAVCVVGLRVYSKLTGSDLTLEVVRPPVGDRRFRKRRSTWKADGRAAGAKVAVGGANATEKSDTAANLDPDDPNKGVAVAEPEHTAVEVAKTTVDS